MNDAWTPLFRPDVARRARAAIDSIAASQRGVHATHFQQRALIAQAAAEGEPPLGDEALRARQASVSRGAAGAAMFQAEVARARGCGDAAAYAGALCDVAIDGALQGPDALSLYDGQPGIGFAVDHVDRLLNGDVSDDGDDGFDDAVLAALEGGRWRGPWDLVSGLVGVGVAALARLPRARAGECLDAVVTALIQLAIPASGGRTLYRHPELLPAWQRERTPDGFFDLGHAHGVAGAIALLGEVVAVRPTLQAHHLLDDLVGWLLAQRTSSDDDAAFPSRIAPGQPPMTGRGAWCYGDPGVAIALLIAARGARRPALEQVAIAVARRAAAAAPSPATTTDTGLCHGAASIGHIFHRLHQATGDLVLREVAATWLERAIELHERGEAGGDAGLLYGNSGVGLALLAAVEPREPAWDRLLLLRVPSASR